MHGALVALPARTFVLGAGLDVDVSDGPATVWRRREHVHVLLADATAVVLDLDLVTAGVNARVDRGPVTVWPCWDEDVVCLGLRGSRHAVVELPRPAFADFLAAVADTRR